MSGRSIHAQSPKTRQGFEILKKLGYKIVVMWLSSENKPKRLKIYQLESEESTPLIKTLRIALAVKQTFVHRPNQQLVIIYGATTFVVTTAVVETAFKKM